MIINDKILNLCEKLAIITDTMKKDNKEIFSIAYYQDSIEIKFDREKLNGIIYCYYENGVVYFDDKYSTLDPISTSILSKLLFALEKQLKKEKEKEEIL